METETVPVIVVETHAITLEEQINSWHAQLCQLGNNGLGLALQIGKSLAEKQTELGHGKWTRWVEDHLDFSVRTAGNYLRIYKNQVYLLQEGVTTLDQAYKKLCPSSAKPKEKVCHLTEEQMDAIEVRVDELVASLKKDCGAYYKEGVDFAVAELKDQRTI